MSVGFEASEVFDIRVGGSIQKGGRYLLEQDLVV
jgi:hypothetical protein